MSEAKCIGRSAEGAGRAIIKLANASRVDVELRTYLQIEKYIGPKTTWPPPRCGAFWPSAKKKTANAAAACCCKPPA